MGLCTKSLWALFFLLKVKYEIQKAVIFVQESKAEFKLDFFTILLFVYVEFKLRVICCVANCKISIKA